MKSNANPTTMWPLDKLKPNAKQSSFSPPTDIEIKQLADDIKRNGLLTPIEILSDGTIICGHSRLLAAKKLQKTEVLCVVRRDLEDAGPAAIEERLLDDNLNRRQLSNIDIARAYKRLVELRPSRKNTNGTGEFRDQTAQRLRMSGRNLDRLLKLAEAPGEIQAVLAERKLPQGHVDRFMDLPQSEREKILKQIRSGTPAKEAIERNSRYIAALFGRLQKRNSLTSRLNKAWSGLSRYSKEPLPESLRESVQDLMQACAEALGVKLPQ